MGATTQIKTPEELHTIITKQKGKATPSLAGDDKKDQQFRFVPFKEYMAGPLEPPQWLIKDILEREALSVLFGPPESYKSFLAIDWGLSIASQTSWNGHAVKGGPVFSIIGEGARGYRRRLAAWRKVHLCQSDIPFFVSEIPAQILDVTSATAVGHAINRLRSSYGAPALVIIDTLARNFGPGHENDTKDMTAFIANLDRYIGRDFSRLIVHHSGLTDQGRSRGSSSLRAALDAEYKMSCQEEKVTITCTKMKDAPRFKPLHFVPQIMALGGTEDDPITSVVLSRVEGQPATVKLTTQWRDALKLLQEMCSEKVSELLSEWRKALCAEKIYSRAGAYSACDTLSDKGFIVISGDYVRLSELSERVLSVHHDRVLSCLINPPPLKGGDYQTHREKLYDQQTI